MRTIKKTLAFLLVLAMLVAVPVCTASAEESASIFGAEILNSITSEEKTGDGLAFRIVMNVKGAKIDAWNNFINTDATAVYNGVEYSVVSMGAVLANQASMMPTANQLTREDVNAEGTVLDIPAKFLCAVPEADSCEFAVRAIRLPAAARGVAIACRPYIVLKDALDNEFTVYADFADISTFNTHHYSVNVEETPVLGVSGITKVSMTTIKNQPTQLSASAVAEYAPLCPDVYKEGFKVTVTLNNTANNAKVAAGAPLTYICKDAEGNVLDTVTVQMGELLKKSSTNVEFYAPIETASIVDATAAMTYVPDVILPAIGSDIDVTKKKDRIRVSATEAAFNADGTIRVSLTFKNYSTTWITEETDFVKCAFYKDGSRKGTKTINIGVIDTKKNPVRTYEMDVPYYTTEVQITSSTITYWTEWS